MLLTTNDILCAVLAASTTIEGLLRACTGRFQLHVQPWPFLFHEKRSVLFLFSAAETRPAVDTAEVFVAYGTYIKW